MSIVAYLVNQYPKVSHSFIRREILALEQCGATVHRFSIRAGSGLKDEADLAEATRTRVLLAGNAGTLAASMARLLLVNPRGLLRGLWQALRLGRRSDRGVARHLAYLLEAAILLSYLRRLGVEHLHAHFATNPAAVAMLCRLLGGPSYSFTVHGPDDFERAPRLGLADKIGLATFVTSVSQYGLQQLRPWCRQGDTTKLHIIPMGVDAVFLDAPPAPIPVRPRLVFVGRLEPQKNPLLLVEAMLRLREAGVHCELEVIGNGPLQDRMRRRIGAAGLQRHIRLRGAASAAEVRDAIVAARALVLPSAGENLPVVIMEALALGRPVVATRVGAVAELAEPGCCAWLVEPGDADALARAMVQAVQADPARLEAMGRAGRTRVEARHDARVAAAQLLALFRGAGP